MWLLTFSRGSTRGRLSSSLFVKGSEVVGFTCFSVCILCIVDEAINSFHAYLGQFPRVDKLVAKAKKVFLKAPSRILLFKTDVPGVALPPEPVLARREGGRYFWVLGGYFLLLRIF